MKQNTNKYQYEQLERYKESLELAHLKTKTIIVNAIVFVFAVVVLYFLIETNVGTSMILSTMTMFLVLLFYLMNYF